MTDREEELLKDIRELCTQVQRYGGDQMLLTVYQVLALLDIIEKLQKRQ